MTDNTDFRPEALITIIDLNLSESITDLFKNNQLPVFLLTYGYGSAKSVIYDILGYGGPRKIVSLSIQSQDMANYIIKQLQNEIDFNKPGTGIAFTISLSSISRALSMVCQQADENFKIGSENVTVNTKEPYHLILTIVNNGHFEQVMEAAKSAGATGGTLVHARGLGSKEAIKYLGITIQPEKDLVLILTTQEKKLAIMESITREVGLNTAGMGICFSLPVNNVFGFEAGMDIVKDMNL